MQNPVAYFELAGPDAERLGRFYGSVFGWSYRPGPFPGYQSLTAEAGAGLAGGLREEAEPECVIYVRVPDLTAALAEVERGGGKVLIPPTEVPGVVTFALFQDPAGNRVGLII